MKTPPTPLILFLVLMGIIGLAPLGAALYSCLRNYQVTRWPTVEGRLLSSKIKQTQVRRGTAYEVTAAYEYEISGVKRTGNRIAYSYQASRNLKTHQLLLKRIRSGHKLLVRYSPDQPDESALAYGFDDRTKGLLIFAFIWFTFLFGIVMMVWFDSRPDEALLKSIVTP